MANLIPLHIHTEYSLLDGMIRVDDLVDYAKENELPAIAITDHGVMYSAVEFYELAKHKGINPLIGCEFYVHNSDIHVKDSSNNPLYHLILIAKDNQGYKNLIKLVSTAWCEGFYYKPRINFELLKEYHEGLICASACLGGEVLQNLLAGDKDKAKETALRYKELFGDDYYIELQDHGLEDQKKTNPDLIKLARELDIKMIITNDSHYLRKQDADAQDTLLCLQTNANKDDEKRFSFPNNEFYVKSKDEMRQAFSWMDDATFEECVQNTEEIANKCNVEIELHNAPLPHYDVPDEFLATADKVDPKIIERLKKKNKTESTDDVIEEAIYIQGIEDYLEHVVFEGLKKRYGDPVPESIVERAKYELGVINQMGFPAYFMITWDFIHYAKVNDIPVGPGRGSAAGSVVAYALEITDIDPIYHKLLFERFLNPERFTMPDVDIDFCIERRGEVIDYVTQKYGEDKVCQIITFSTYAPKAAFKGVGRVLQVPFAESNRITGLIEPALDVARATNPKAEWLRDIIAAEGTSDFKQLYNEDYQILNPESGKTISFKRWVDMAIAIEGLKCGTGTHAAGVIISHAPLDTILPVQPSKDGIVQTGYPKHEATEVLDLLKMDFLGLRNLTMITKTCKMVKKYRGIDVDINHIPLDDKPTYDMLVKGETIGVFQLESQGMMNLVKRLKPDVFEDLGALVALFRPGPLGSGMVDDFVARKHGKQEITYAHPLLEPVLNDTYGTIVYQEQIMQVFQVLADYSLGQADQVRRMMGKKDLKTMEEQRGKFIEASAKHEMKKEDAEKLFNQILAFASYCFNRSHSAAYAFVAYQTAYLKKHYPVEYFSALLSSVADNKDQTQLYIEEAQRYGCKVLAPDVNKSYLEYAPDGDNIRFGMAAIKGVGAPVVEAIIKEREANGDFKSIFDFCKRVDAKYVNKKSLEGLIKAGAFSNIEKSRKQLFENIEHILDVTSKEAKDRAMGQVSLFASVENAEEFSGVQYQLVGSDEEYTDKEIQLLEKEFLGFYVTSHPLFSIRDKVQYLTTHRITELNDVPEEGVVTICGLITATRQIPTKKDPSKFLRFVTLEDLSGKVDCVCFHRKLLEYGEILEPDNKVVITGKVQHRGEDQISLVVDSVKSVENSNIVTVSLLDEIKYEELCGIKNILAKYHGDDPVMIKLPPVNGYSTRIMTSSIFWVNSTNELVNNIKQVFPNRIDVSINSLDKPIDSVV
ncbi:MAG: DNA polymerase III subunit alpha [Candidatus Gastranaerophilales bacterium]|nr:DNA polymerase III subunit alpha [Candidatus Gastranaerophilales bacterium]